MKKINILLSLVLPYFAHALSANFVNMAGTVQTITGDTLAQLADAVVEAIEDPHRCLPKFFPDNTSCLDKCLFGSEEINRTNALAILAHAPDPAVITVVKKPIEFVEVAPCMGDPRFISTRDAGLVLCGNFNIGPRDSIANCEVNRYLYFIKLHVSPDRHNSGEILSLTVDPKNPVMTKEMQDALLNYFHRNSHSIRGAFMNLLATDRSLATRLLFTYAVGAQEEMQSILERINPATLQILREAELIPA